jgi:hypothetical protein
LELELIQTLQKKSPALAIIQQPGLIEPEANAENERLSRLHHFLVSHPKVYESPEFSVYAF